MRFIIICMLLVLTGCATTGSYYKGARVEGDIIPLPARASQLVWQDLYLKVDYALSRQGDMLRIEGNLSFALYPKVNLARADDVTLSLYLLDDRGIVQSYQELVRALGTNLDEKVPFRKDIPFTKEVTAVWFGYEGTLLGQMDDGMEFIWKRPKRSS
jgi:hypothetical protein